MPEHWPRREVSTLSAMRPVVLVVGGFLALAASGCGETAAGQLSSRTPSSVVRRDLSRIAHALPGSRAGAVSEATKSQRCVDRQGGTPLARVERIYGYPPNHPSVTVDVSVEYRSPANSRRLVATYITADGGLGCPRRAVTRWYRRWASRHLPPGSRTVNVRVTAGLPHRLAVALGQEARGYRGTLTIPGVRPRRFDRIYSVTFIYQDERDPHVVYTVNMIVDRVSVSFETPIALRVIRATR